MTRQVVRDGVVVDVTPVRFSGINASGKPKHGAPDLPDVQGWIDARHAAGWTELVVLDALTGKEIGGITTDPNSGVRRRWTTDNPQHQE